LSPSASQAVNERPIAWFAVQLAPFTLSFLGTKILATDIAARRLHAG